LWAVKKFPTDAPQTGFAGPELGARDVDVVCDLRIYRMQKQPSRMPTRPRTSRSCVSSLSRPGHLFEIVDPKTGDVLPPETPGELVFTPLDARGTVVLRYRTGDLVEGDSLIRAAQTAAGACRDSWATFRVARVREMRLDKIKGTLVDFNELEHLLDDYAHVGACKIELRKIGTTIRWNSTTNPARHQTQWSFPKRSSRAN